MPMPVISRSSGCSFDLEDGCHDVLGALLAHALEVREIRDAEVVEIGNVVNRAAVNELIDEHLTELVDVHRVATREVKDGTFHDGRTPSIRAAPCDFILTTLNGRVAAGAAVGHHETPLRAFSRRNVDAHDLRDDLARLLDGHDVADPRVESGDDVRVVKGRARYRRARELYGLQDRDRRERAGAPDLHDDVDQARLRLFSVEFVARSPSEGNFEVEPRMSRC